MRSVCLVVTAAVTVSLLGGCECCEKSKKKQQQAFDPTEQYPEWAYDAPFYYRPASERGEIGDTDPPRWPGGPTHYYVRSRTVFLPRPSRTPTTSPATPTIGLRTTEAGFAPRTGVYWTETGGLEWHKAGYFGVDQTHFAYPAENDGVYGFRFIGPQMPPAKCSPPRPQVVYHVDTVPPEVVVYVEPNQPVYGVNEQVTVYWMASDINLVESSVSVSACWDDGESGKPPWLPIVSDQPVEGSMTFVIPPHAVGMSLKLRGDARDRAGNVGVGVSIPLPVVEEAATTQPTPTATSQPVDDDLQVTTLLGEGELASFVEPPAVSKDDTSPGGRPVAAASQPADGLWIDVPPASANPERAGRHWSARPWQTLSRPRDGRAESVWSLPTHRLPVTDTHTDEDTPEANP